MGRHSTLGEDSRMGANILVSDGLWKCSGVRLPIGAALRLVMYSPVGAEGGTGPVQRSFD